MNEITYASDHPAVAASLHAITLGRKSWEAYRDECYAWAAVRDLLDANAGSNVKQRCIHWRKPRTGARSATYYVQVHGPAGVIDFATSAPQTLEAAQSHPLLQKAIARRDETLAALRADFGNWKQQHVGVTKHIEAVLRTTPQGRSYMSDGKHCAATILVKIATADAYSVDEWSPKSSGFVHQQLRTHPGRVKLIQTGITSYEAETIRAEHHALRRENGYGSGRPANLAFVRSHARAKVNADKENPFRPIEVPRSLRIELRNALRAGVSQKEIRRVCAQIARDEATMTKAA